MACAQTNSTLICIISFEVKIGIFRKNKACRIGKNSVILVILIEILESLTSEFLILFFDNSTPARSDDGKTKFPSKADPTVVVSL